jgi:hypothetical protein
MFTPNDLNQFQSKGIEIKIIEKQIEDFKKGFPFAQLINAATIGNGIHSLNPQQIEHYLNYYVEHSKENVIIKFVPASGAASRMFKRLFEFVENYKETPEDKIAFQKDQSFDSVFNFIKRIKDFAFYEDLKAVLLKDGFQIDKLIQDEKYQVIVDYLLNPKGLDYGNLPKGLLKFHNYKAGNRMPIEEHLVEAALYGKDNDEKAAIHFTVSPEHLAKFKIQIENVIQAYEDMHKIKFDVSFSFQKASTDTIAVNMDNDPFRNRDGSLVFRPGGHGALIENLNDLDGDVVFIKNIDNVVPDILKPDTKTFKEVIGGLLLETQFKTFTYLKELEQNQTDELKLEEISKFAVESANIKLPKGFTSFAKDQKKKFLFHHLNRPIRICGMVKNEGEPGGGPFWVKNSKGEVSLQIVESSQVNLDDQGQKEIMQTATHFNPVDLVCGIKDYKGNAFDLHHYIDPETGFISIKSKDGKDLKALELPGLWNGAMANWITLFVEVPISTFNPVKTVNDLLREQHQAR